MSSLFTVVAILAVFVIAAAGALFLYTKTRSDTSRLFTPRQRRLAFVERTALDGGRRLLLVRRDDVEHLILIGGPIDLIVETGIRPEGLARGEAAQETFADRDESYPARVSTWERPDLSLPAAKAEKPAGPRHSIAPDTAESAGDMLELTSVQEAKAVP